MQHNTSRLEGYAVNIGEAHTLRVVQKRMGLQRLSIHTCVYYVKRHINTMSQTFGTSDDLTVHPAKIQKAVYICVAQA